MNILLVSNFYKPSWESGGVTKVNYELAKELVHRGHNVTVYTTDGFDPRLNVRKNVPVNVEGVIVYYFYNLSRTLVTKMKLPIPYYAPFVLRKEIKNFDIIHIHEHRTLLAVLIHNYANKYNIPYVLQAHGSVMPFLQKQKLKKIFDIFFGYNILKDAARVIALNKTEASQYHKMGVNPNKIGIVPNGINISDYNKTPKIGTFRAIYSINTKDKIILYVGRIHRNKGIDLLVNSYSILIKDIPDSKLVLVGPDDGFRDELEKSCDNLGIRKNVLFTGFVDSETKMAALMDSDIFVTPSFTGFPVSFLEACFFGLPIVTTSNGDNLDWIDNEVGYVVRYDSKELSNAIFKILNDGTLRKSFSDEAKKLVENTFTMDSYITNIETLYQKCIKSNE